MDEEKLLKTGEIIAHNFIVWILITATPIAAGWGIIEILAHYKCSWQSITFVSFLIIAWLAAGLTFLWKDAIWPAFRWFGNARCLVDIKIAHNVIKRLKTENPELKEQIKFIQTSDAENSAKSILEVESEIEESHISTTIDEISGEKLSTKTRNKYLKVIVALAEDNPNIKIDEYGAQTATVNTLAAMGIKISAASVGQVFAEARELKNRQTE